MKLEHKLPFSTEHVVVTWCFFNVCNYSCSYCSPFYHDGSKSGVNLGTAERFIRALLAARPGKKFLFEFTGGEVTLFPKFPALLKFLKKNHCSVSVISNGSKPLPFWNEIAEDIDHLAFSYHPESASPDHFLKLFKLLEGRTSVHLTIMALDSRFEELQAFGAEVQEKFPSVTVTLEAILNAGAQYSPKEFLSLGHQILGNNQIARVHPEQSLALLSKPHRPFRKLMLLKQDDGTSVELDPRTDKKNSWRGWECYAGVENLIVDWDGNIFRGWCKVGGLIANIRDENINLPQGPVSCTKDLCTNSFDIAATKIRPE